MIEAGKLIVLNKFSPVETRVTFLIDALKKVELDVTLLDDKRKSFLKEVLDFRPEGMAEEGPEGVANISVAPAENVIVNP